MSQQAIDFFFDFSSPYGYLASQRIEALAARHGRKVRWRPILLGVAFKTTGTQPLVQIPLKGPYAKRDLERTARLYAIPLTWPKAFPFASIAACRAFYWLEEEAPEQAPELAKALFRRAFGEGGDVASSEGVIEVAGSLGLARERVAAALQDPAVKDRLRRVNEEAIAEGVFGSPYIVVDGEPFWGNDHLDQVERWIETGGW